MKVSQAREASNEGQGPMAPFWRRPYFDT